MQDTTVVIKGNVMENVVGFRWMREGHSPSDLRRLLEDSDGEPLVWLQGLL